MATIYPAIRGTLGNTTYYETTMKVGELLAQVSPPSDFDEWADQGPAEKMQRKPDLTRIKKHIAPYLANSPDQFFGALIVLHWAGEITFESVDEFGGKSLPAPYRSTTKKMGFFSIEGGKLVVLDGQHRYLALKAVRDDDITGEHAEEIINDDVSVIIISHETNVKTRRIFNTVNRYAKQTSRGDDIITSEDDAYAIVAREMLSDDFPFAPRVIGGKPEEIVNWKSNTLSKRSTRLTTLSALYESTVLILKASGVDKLNKQERPEQAELEHYEADVKEVWDQVLDGMAAYKAALLDPKTIPSLRDDNAKTALLFKPASQIALIDGLLRCTVAEGPGMTLKEAIERADAIPDWSMTNPTWRGVIVKQNGTIDAGGEARRRMADLLVYLIAADRLPDDRKLDIWQRFNSARGHDVEAYLRKIDRETPVEDLPDPVDGARFTKEDALASFVPPASEAA